MSKHWDTHDVPICDGHAQSWFTERNHPEAECIVCAHVAANSDILQRRLNHALMACCAGNTEDGEPVRCQSYEASEQSVPCPRGCCVMADATDVRATLAAIEREEGMGTLTMLAENMRALNGDICGFCGLPGADKIPHPVRWPGEESAGTPYVHSACEDAECRRAHSLLTDEQRRKFLSQI